MWMGMDGERWIHGVASMWKEGSVDGGVCALKVVLVVQYVRNVTRTD